MGYKWIYSTFARLTVLAAGVSLLTVGILKENWWVGIVGGILCVVMLFVSYWMQQQLREKSWLMLEAIRNRDYSFRLPLSGFSGGERVLQETLNQFGNLMGEQKQLMEQRERFYEQILSVVSSGIVVFDENQSIVQTNPAAARLLGLPILSTLRQLERYGSDIPQLLRMLKAGERCNLQYTTAKGEVQLSVHATEMQVGEETVRILTLNDIRNELDAKELDSWIKLTRVLTHEIMNSIAPISSLSETFLKRKDVIDSPIYEGIRSLIPDNISLTLQIEPSELMLYADPNLIRQVLINILKNAVQSIGEVKGRIHVRAYSASDEHIFIYISNDGPTIPEAEAEQIFVPFFTTRAGGSGIGLSLSRQIMKLSNGSISLLRAGTNGWNTTFSLYREKTPVLLG